MLDPQKSCAEKRRCSQLCTVAGKRPRYSIQTAIKDSLADAIRAWLTAHPEAVDTASRTAARQAIRYLYSELVLLPRCSSWWPR
jgi:hypothetical protein